MKSTIFSNSGKSFLPYLLLLLVIVFAVTSTFSAYWGEGNPEGKGIRTLYLIRHGEYDHEDQRNPDVGRALIPLGIAQARLVTARLRSLPVKMTSLHSSTMTRALQTAMVINQDFPELKLQQSRLIRECVPLTWRKDIMAEEDPLKVKECQSNLEKAFTKYFTPSPEKDRHDIIVCHGNVIRYFVTKVLKVDTMAWLGMTIYNCSLTIVRIYPNGTMKLVSFNDIGHIPTNLQTETGPIKKERYLHVQ